MRSSSNGSNSCAAVTSSKLEIGGSSWSLSCEIGGRAPPNQTASRPPGHGAWRMDTLARASERGDVVSRPPGWQKLHMLVVLVHYYLCGWLVILDPTERTGRFAGLNSEAETGVALNPSSY
jgi:hypothetical protein